MSDKVELIAAAQVVASDAGISFRSNFGFKTASRNSPGVYELQLDDSHDAKKLVIGVTGNNASGGEIQAAIAATGDTRSIGVTNFDLANAPADTGFFITVYRVRS
jgi:hypothetical protein